MLFSPKRVLPLLILAVGIGGFAILRATRPDQPPAEARERVWQVAVMEVRPEEVSPLLTLYGRVETPAQVKAAAPGPGRVAEVTVKEGDPVEPGQRLLALDPRDFEPRLQQARADVADLKAQIESESLRYEADVRALAHERKLLVLNEAAVARAERLLKQKLGSDADLDRARQDYQRQALAVNNRQLTVDEHQARMDQLQARLQRAEAQLAQSTLDWERSRVVADFSGYVGKLLVAAGDQVQTGQTLLTLYPTAALEVRAKVPAPFQNEVHQALAADARLTASARIGGQTLVLSLDRLSGEADPSGPDALFRIEQGAGVLRLGTMLTLQLRRQPRADAVALPFEALYGSNRVYKLMDGRLQGVSVTPLGEYQTPAGEPRLLVFSPELRSGDRVVVTHLPNAVTGLRVTAVSG